MWCYMRGKGCRVAVLGMVLAVFLASQAYAYLTEVYYPGHSAGAPWGITTYLKANETKIIKTYIYIENKAPGNVNISFSATGNIADKISFSQNNIVLGTGTNKRVNYTITVSSIAYHSGSIITTYRRPGSSWTLESRIWVDARPDGKPAPDFRQADVDGDGRQEEAADQNYDASDGYESYADPNVNTNAIKVDGDGDGKADWLVDIGKDGTFEKYWDPDRILLGDVYAAGSYYLFDGNGDLRPDRQYNGTLKQIKSELADMDGDGDQEYWFDINSNNIFGAEDRIWEGSLYTLPDIETNVHIPTAPAERIPFNATVILNNLGTYGAKQFFLQVKLDSGEIFRQLVPSLDGNSSRTFLVAVNATLGNHTLEADANNNEFVKDVNRDNNRKTVTFSAGSAASPTPSPSISPTPSPGATPTATPSPSPSTQATSPPAQQQGSGQSGGGSSGSAQTPSPSITPSPSSSALPDTPESGGGEEAATGPGLVIKDKAKNGNISTNTSITGKSVSGEIPSIVFAAIGALVVIVGFALLVLRSRGGL